MFKLLSPNQMTGIAYKERGKHEHPDLMEKLTKMLKMPVDTKKMNRNFSCHTKTVCTKINPLQKIKSSEEYIHKSFHIKRHYQWV